jgi:hypothetical protein
METYQSQSFRFDYLIIVKETGQERKFLFFDARHTHVSSHTVIHVIPALCFQQSEFSFYQKIPAHTLDPHTT